MIFTTNPTVDQLGELTIFGGLKGRVRRKLARHFETITADAGTTLIAEGTLNHYTYFILEGEVEVRVCGAVVATLGPDAVVGERTMLGEISTNAGVVCTTPVTALAVDHRALRALADDNPAVMKALVTTAEQRAAA